MSMNRYISSMNEKKRKRNPPKIFSNDILDYLRIWNCFESTLGRSNKNYCTYRFYAIEKFNRVVQLGLLKMIHETHIVAAQMRNIYVKKKFWKKMTITKNVTRVDKSPEAKHYIHQWRKKMKKNYFFVAKNLVS